MGAATGAFSGVATVRVKCAATLITMGGAMDAARGGAIACGEAMGAPTGDAMAIASGVATRTKNAPPWHPP